MNKLWTHGAVQYPKYKETIVKISTMDKYYACAQHSNIQQHSNSFSYPSVCVYNI